MPERKSRATRKVKAARAQRSAAHRLRSVRLVILGNSPEKVAARFGDSRRAVANWVMRYRQHGEAGLKDMPRSGRPSKLTSSQSERLRRMVAEAYRRSDEVSGGILARMIEDNFRITLTRRQCERILKRLLEPK